MSGKPPSAHIVIGPESSGTRFLTGILIDAGCTGDAGHAQRWDTMVPKAKKYPHIVWRKSVPHGKAWPRLTHMVRTLESNGYKDVRVIVLVREPFALQHSQVKRRHVPNIAAACRNIRKAYLHIFNHLAKSGAAFSVVSYEALALHGVPARRSILDELGLRLLKPNVTPRNENAKHYKHK